MSKRTYAKAAGIMMAAILVSRLLGLVREAVIAAKFGQGEMTDIYRLVFKVPDIIFFVVAGGALSSAFIPVFTDYLTRGENKEAWKVYSVISSFMGLVVAAFIVVFMIFARQIVPIIAPGFGPAEWDQIAALTRIVLPSQFFFFIGGITMGTLYARDRFLVPALGPAIYNLGIIAGGVFLADHIGIAGLCWGALLGAFVGNFALQVYYSSRLGVEYRFSLDIHHSGVRKVFSLMLPVILGLSIAQIDILINTTFATMLEKGAVSALENANRLMQVPMGVFGQAAGIAALPVLSALAAKKDWKEYRETLNFSIRSLFFVMIPSGLFMMALARPIVSFLLEGGKFDASDTVQAANALVFYSIGVFAWGGQAIVARGFYALHDTRTPIILGTIMTALFIPMNYGIVRLAGSGVDLPGPPIIQSLMGHPGLALATSIIAVTYMLSLSILLAKRVGGIGGGQILSSSVRILLSATIAAIAAYFVAGQAAVFEASSGALGIKAKALGQLLPALTIGGIIYLGLCKAMKVDEATTFTQMIKRRFKKR